MPQRVRLDLPQALNHLAREPGHPCERKVPWNPTMLGLSSPLDLALLAPQVAGVFDGRFGARDVERRARRIDFDPAIALVGPQRVEQILQPRRWLTKELAS